MQFLGASYTGQTTADGHRGDGFGEYVFPNGDKYVGSFLDGVFHGHGVIFFKGNENERGSPSAFLKGSLSDSGSEGQYRGVWEFGKNVSGSFVFPDGLVIECDGDSFTSGKNWPYCQNGDHRLWKEHLKKVTPVLPCDSLLGGVTLQSKKKATADLWEKSAIWAPSTLVEELTAPAYVQRQPRCSTDLPSGWWKEEEVRERIAQLISLPTPPLDVTDDNYSGKAEANLFPLQLLPKSIETGSRHLKTMTRQSERTKSVVADVPEHILKQESHVDKNDPSVDPVRGSLHGTPAIPADPTVGKSSVNYLQGPDSYGNTSVSPIQGNMTSSPLHGNTETNSIEVGAMPVSNLQTRYSNAGDVSAPSIHGNMTSSPLHGNAETNSIEVGAMPVSYLQTRYSNAGDVSAPSIHGNMVASPIRSPQNATAADAILGRVPEYNLTGKYPEAGINSVNSVHATLNQSSSTLEKL